MGVSPLFEVPVCHGANGRQAGGELASFFN
jgi:hypothetical protein